MTSQTKKRRRIWLASIGFVLLVGVGYVLMIVLSPELGTGPSWGPHCLSNDGYGYGLGDVVWTSNPAGGYVAGDLVAYDWFGHGVSIGLVGGFGPPCQFALIIARPGDVLEIRRDQTTINNHPMQVGLDTNLAKTFGMPTQGRYTIPLGIYLVHSGTSLVPMKETHIVAKVHFKIGRDYRRAWQLKNRVY